MYVYTDLYMSICVFVLFCFFVQKDLPMFTEVAITEVFSTSILELRHLKFKKKINKFTPKITELIKDTVLKLGLLSQHYIFWHLVVHHLTTFRESGKPMTISKKNFLRRGKLGV